MSDTRLVPDVAVPAHTADIALSEVLSALSYALDLTEGQLPGHTIRSCIIGMRLGQEVGLTAEEQTALYFALLLKDAGCSSNAARMAALFGSDDQGVKLDMKLVDWHNPVALALATARSCAIGQSLGDRVRQFLAIAKTEHVTRDLIQVRCDRGAGIALRLGFPEATAQAIRSLDEHWCGLGYPEGRSGEDISLLARIANLAQAVEVFWRTRGVDAALAEARRRRGRWFDPKLVDLLLTWERDREWWARLAEPAEIGAAVVSLEPGSHARRIDDSGLDAVAQAFAEIIDAKSPYTARHSSNVAAYAVRIARTIGLDAAEQRRLYRAGLLHDIGKLGVSNRILDKPGALTAAERAQIERHPSFTWEILQRVRAFDGFARLAAVHHEKLDGSGYPWGLTARELDLASQVLCVADMYEALSADRPYRKGLSHADVLAVLRKESGTRLCAEAVAGAEGLGEVPALDGDSRDVDSHLLTPELLTRAPPM